LWADKQREEADKQSEEADKQREEQVRMSVFVLSIGRIFMTY
jgi:hypothetical protein